MTDRDMHLLRIMVDPVNHVTSLGNRDRAAISAATSRNAARGPTTFLCDRNLRKIA